MSPPDPAPATQPYTTMNRGSHSLQEAGDAQEFCLRFESAAGRSLRSVVSTVIIPTAAHAVFVVGSIPLGMGTSGSDVDLIVLTDSRDALAKGDSRIANDERHLEFSNESDSLLAGIFLSMSAGVLVDLHVAITPQIQSIYGRLRRRGPDLNETEIRTLGRLSSGWLLWESEDYLKSHPGVLGDTSLPVYCATKHYVAALHERAKAIRALQLGDIPLTLQHGRTAVERTYLCWFASQDLTYLGTKWLAQLGHARGAAQRLRQHPLLERGVQYLFPVYPATSDEAQRYLESVSEFLTSMRRLIEEKTLYRIAFSACPQVHPL